MYTIGPTVPITLTRKREVLRFLVFTIMGFGVLFGTVLLFRSNGNPVDSLVIATAAGFAAIAVSGSWLLRYKQGCAIYVLLLISYLGRVLLGIYVYLELDPDYFRGTGAYSWGHPEIELSFLAARTVFEAFSTNTSFTLSSALSVLNEGDTKNPLIHWWMGLFLASGSSPNAMDLAPFNAFHMSLSALGIVALGLGAQNSRRASFLAGIVTAYCPFSFISSLLWRDAVGIFFVVLSVVLASEFRLRSPKTWPLLSFAVFLSFAHRTVYPVIILMAYFLSLSAPVQGEERRVRPVGRIAIWVAGAIIVLVITRIFSDYLFAYYTNFSIGAVFQRLLFLPILFVRAILGPFPWFDELSLEMFWNRIFEYAFHVLQLTVFLVVISNYRRFFKSPDIQVYAFLLLFGAALLAPGIHTAYLAVGLPFALTRTFSIARSFPLYLCSSLILFLFFNLFFYASGLSGQGLSQAMTGY